MKVTFIAILLISAFLFLFKTGTSQTTSKAYKVMLEGMYQKTVPLLTVAEATKRIDHALILDTRELEEFEVSHLPNAQHIGYNNFNEKAMSNTTKDTLIMLYCSVGYRSERIGEKLQKLGFTNVHNIYGGIFEWKNQDQQVVNQNNEPTEEIHAYSKSWGIWLNKGKKVY